MNKNIQIKINNVVILSHMTHHEIGYYTLPGILCQGAYTKLLYLVQRIP